MKKKELMKLRQKALDEMTTILDTAESEKRGLTPEEKVKYDELEAEVDRIERSLRKGVTDHEYQVETLKTQFSQDLRKLLRGEVNSVEILNSRSVTVTGDVTSAVPTYVNEIIEPLEKGMIMDKVGTKIITGMKMNQKWPVAPSVEATYAEEAVALEDSKLTISDITPEPKRVGFRIAVSNAAIDSTDGMLLDQIVLPQIQKGLTRLLNRVMFSPTLVSPSGNPGCFVSPKHEISISAEDLSSGQNLFSLLQSVVGMVEADGIINDGTYAYIMSAKLANALKTLPIDAGSGKFLLADGKIGGIPVFQTEYITDQYIGFGRFSDQFVGQFGDIRLTLDDKTGAASDVTYVTINAYFALKTIRKEAFGRIRLSV